MLHLVKTIEVEDFNVQSKEGNHLFIDGYVGCYSDHELSRLRISMFNQKKAIISLLMAM